MEEAEKRRRITQLRAEIDQRQAEKQQLENELGSPNVLAVGHYYRHWSVYEDEFDSVDDAIGTLEAMSDNGGIGDHWVTVGGAPIEYELGDSYPHTWTWH